MLDTGEPQEDSSLEDVRKGQVAWQWESCHK